MMEEVILTSHHKLVAKLDSPESPKTFNRFLELGGFFLLNL